MSEQAVFHDIRKQVASLLDRPTEDLDEQALYLLIKDGIDHGLDARRQTHGGSSILTLNGLLVAERLMREKVFGAARKPITAG